MNAGELRQKTDEELHKELLELLREQFNLRVQKTVTQQARSDQFSRARKDIARLKTVQNERRRAGNSE